MITLGYGEVSVPAWKAGYPWPPPPPSRPMRIHRTASNVVPESHGYAAHWGKLGITPNAQLVSLSGSADDAIAALDRAGPRGAAALGAAVGFVFSSSRLTGALVGGLLGYFGGAYLTNFAKKALAIVNTTTAVASAVTPKAAP